MLKKYVIVLLFFLESTASRSTPGTVDLIERIDQLTIRLAAVESKLENSGVPIAFYATLSTTLQHVGDHQHIIFDNVVTNIAGGYNPTHGQFTAPVRGAYAFFVVLTNTPDHAASVILVRNGQWIGHVVADDTGHVTLTSTLAVTVQLEAGDQVWVQNEYSYSDVEMIDGYNWSSFSGHLIQKM